MRRFRSARRLLRKFAQLGGSRRGLLLEALAHLLAARLALVLVPFPRLAGWLGRFVAPADAYRAQPALPDPTQAALAAEIGWAVTRAAHRAPFRAVCLPQAMAAQAMLRRRGVASVMHFGVARDPAGATVAHAWLDAAGIEVTGYPLDPRLAEIACFV